jgi:hypothetical protein
MELSNFIAYEQGALDFGATLDFFSELIKSGQCWQLQGHYGRMATSLIREGLISEQGEVNQERAYEFLNQ